MANENGLKYDNDVIHSLTLLARITEPNNIDVYFDADGKPVGLERDISYI